MVLSFYYFICFRIRCVSGLVRLVFQNLLPLFSSTYPGDIIVGGKLKKWMVGEQHIGGGVIASVCFRIAIIGNAEIVAGCYFFPFVIALRVM